MASPGSVHEKQMHDPQEEKRITDQSARVKYLFKDLRWRGGRFAFEKWETDGGNVPAEEQVYLVRGHLRRGLLARIEWSLEMLWKRVKLFFSQLFHHHHEPQV